MLPTRLHRPLRACSTNNSVAFRCYATRTKPTSNTSPYANLSALKKNAPTPTPTTVSTPAPAPKPATLRSSTTPSNATVQPEKTTHTASSVRSPGQNFPTAVNPKRAEPPRGQKPAPKTRPPLDPNSKEYKKEYNSLTRRWTAGLIAMPILLVTSYYLFDRIILGHEKKELHRFDSSKNPDESPIKSF